MRRKSLEKANCPIARSLERVGEWWSILILRDALHGFTRFEEFRESLGVAPNILTARLARLVEDGFLERRQYSEHPPRYEYVPTQRGRDFRPVLLSGSYDFTGRLWWFDDEARLTDSTPLEAHGNAISIAERNWLETSPRTRSTRSPKPAKGAMASGGKPGLPRYSMRAPTRARPSTRSPTGRSCMRGTPESA